MCSTKGDTVQFRLYSGSDLFVWKCLILTRFRWDEFKVFSIRKMGGDNKGTTGTTVTFDGW